MIHIITSHHRTGEFIIPQVHFIKRSIKQEYKIWAFYDPLDVSELDKFKPHFYFLENPPPLKDIHKYFKYPKSNKTQPNIPGSLEAHYLKLNFLTDKVLNDSNTKDTDILLYLDGDSFPIAPLDNFIETKLKRYELCGVQRLENGFDIQPHGCFTLTTVKLFKRFDKYIWDNGYAWSNLHTDSFRTDVGGELLRKLIEHRIDWYPLHRTNTVNIHPVCFGIYDDLIYHHGAGFRGVMNAIILRKTSISEEMLRKTKELEDRLIKLENFYDVLKDIKDTTSL